MWIQWERMQRKWECIQNQLEELAVDQISLKEYMDPFTNSKRK